MKHFLTLRKRIRFYSAMSDALKSGLPITRALQTASGIIPAEITQSMYSAVDTGGRIRNTLERCSFFPEIDKRLICLAEDSGSWPEIFALLTEYNESRLDTFSQFAMGMAYPFFLLNAAIVIPSFTTLVLNSFWSFLVSVIPSLLILYTFTGACLYFVSNPSFQSFLSRLPFVGSIFSAQDESNFLLLTGMQYNAGIPLNTSLENAEATAMLPHIRERIARIRNLITAGKSFSEAVKESMILSDSMLTAAIHSAEASGMLPEVLVKEANVLKGRVRKKIAVFNRIFPVICYLVIALFIGMRVISFYTSRFDF